MYDREVRCGPNGCTERSIDAVEQAFRMASWREQIEAWRTLRFEREILQDSVENLQRSLRAAEADNRYLRDQLIACRRASHRVDL